MSKYIQKTIPNLDIRASLGWCLQYADDAVNAPVRRESAGLEYLAQRAAGNVHQEETPPVGLWVPVFFDITSGEYDPYEHVGWAFNHGDGRIEIHDSEVHSGARGVYNSIAEICSWFGNAGLRYLGWSERIGGVQIVEKSDNVRVVNSGVGVNVRYEPTTQSIQMAQKLKWQAWCPVKMSMVMIVGLSLSVRVFIFTSRLSMKKKVHCQIWEIFEKFHNLKVKQ